MELNRDNRDGFVYSPIIKQYDTTFWKTVSGTPAMSSNVLRFTSAVASSYGQLQFADITFRLIVPVKPTAGQARKFGLTLPETTDRGAAYFEVDGTTFKAVTFNSNGATTESTTVTWIDATWTAAAIDYRIRWEKDQVKFYVNGSVVATHSAKVPELYPLSIYINNGTADNLDLTNLSVTNAASII
jgi:hypothetical protein